MSKTISKVKLGINVWIGMDKMVSQYVTSFFLNKLKKVCNE